MCHAKFFVLLALFILKHHRLLIGLMVFFSISLFSFFFSSSIEQGHNSCLMYLHPKLEVSLDDKDGEYLPPDYPPYYKDFLKTPSFTPRSYNDLLGKIELFQLEGLEKLERSMFYNMLDYAVLFVATHFVTSSGQLLPKYEHCLLIHRTLLDYRDQEWHSFNVRSIHEALAVLNDEMVKLLVEYYALDRLLVEVLTFKDLNMASLKHSYIAELLRIVPADFAWGRFSPSGLEEYKAINTWDSIRKNQIRDEMLQEYMICDIDLSMSYLEEKIEENARIYNRFMGQKFALEALDLELFGKPQLTYKEMVHYRTYAGLDFIFRYASMRVYINENIMHREAISFGRELDDYKWTFDPDENKGFYTELADKIDYDVTKKRMRHRNRFYM